jgi:hypothetical protein
MFTGFSLKKLGVSLSIGVRITMIRCLVYLLRIFKMFHGLMNNLVYMYIYIFVCVCVCVCARARACVVRACVRARARACVCVYIYIYIYIYIFKIMLTYRVQCLLWCVRSCIDLCFRLIWDSQYLGSST